MQLNFLDFSLCCSSVPVSRNASWGWWDVIRTVRHFCGLLMRRTTYRMEYRVKQKDKNKRTNTNRHMKLLKCEKRGKGTYSEPGDTSEILCEVAEWGGGDGEGPDAGLGGGVSTVELNEARIEERMSRCSLEGWRLGGAPGAVAGMGYLHEGTVSNLPCRECRASWGSSVIGGGGEDVECDSGCESWRGGKVLSHSRHGGTAPTPPFNSSCSRELLRCSLDACCLNSVLSGTLIPPKEPPSIPVGPPTPTIPAPRSSLDAWMLWTGPRCSLEPSSRRRGRRSRLSRDRWRRVSESKCSREE